MWKTVLINLLVSISVLQGSVSPVVYRPEPRPGLSGSSMAGAIVPSFSGMKVLLQAAGGPNIVFQTQNGRAVRQSRPDQHSLPHLVLKRNGVLTPGYERTLDLRLSGLPALSSGVKVTVSIETQHGDPDLGGGEAGRITVWQETIEIPSDGYAGGSSLGLTIRFEEFTGYQGKRIPTPTDYFRTRIVASDPEGHQLYEASSDFAFLMENQWQVPLPPLAEETPGAAPKRLRVYFCDMFPFEANPGAPGGRLQRAQVEHYIQTELLPEMVQAIRTQSDSWGFPWYAEWTGYRRGEDPKTLSVALTDGDTWYHGAAPSRGHAEISIRVDGGMLEYESLTDGIMSTFHHELFHNLQRNISSHFGGYDDIDGSSNAWAAVTEGTAVLASSVGQPAVQFERTNGWRAYMTRVRAFIGTEGAVGGDLNQSYEDISYHLAVYWRFLYEQCGGLKFGAEDPAAGMAVIRTLLETLYKAESVDIRGSTSIVQSLPGLMDRVFENVPSCPFRTYAESLEHFARAIYQLKLENGRCLIPGIPADCGFYDPNGLYPLPPVRHLKLAPAMEPVAGGIAGSFGIDYIDLSVGPEISGRSLAIGFAGASGSGGVFSLQIYEIITLDDQPSQPAYMVQYRQPVTLRQDAAGGNLVYEIDGTDTGNIDSLGLIITRLDGNEKVNAGEYELTFQVR